MIDIVNRRLVNQRLAGNSFETAAEVVHWLGAVQAQEYLGAKWGVGQRLNDVTEKALDAAFNRGEFLRTHVMRPTWHFVAPADIRWLQMLTAPRVHSLNAYYYRKFGLDETVLDRSHKAIAQALQGGRYLTRSELAAVLQQAGLYDQTDDRLRLAYIMMAAELDCLICNGPIRGKQHTYALMDEWVPQTASLSRDEALAELTRRYFTSHGPATVKDFSWWSGLLVSDVKAGLEMVGSELTEEVVEGISFWFAENTPAHPIASPLAYLLPAYDEYTIAYKDHSPVIDLVHLKQVIAAFGIVIILDGRIIGSWKRTFGKGTVVVELNPFIALTEAQNQAILTAAHRYGQFLNRRVELL
jgi:hypothetical protein